MHPKSHVARFAGFLLALLPLLAASAAAQTMTISGSQLSDSSGNLVANATITFRPVNSAGAPLSYRRPGSGQSTTSPVSAAVSSGVFSLPLPDVSLTSPKNVCFAVTVTDNTSGESLLGPGYSCVQPSSDGSQSTWCTTSTTCNFDLFVPNTPALTVSTAGLPGANGLSAYQVAQANGYTGTQTQWLASLAVGVSVSQLGSTVASAAPQASTANLFVPGTITSSAVLGQDGTVKTGYSGFYASDFIYVGRLANLYSAPQLLNASNYAALCFYDASKTLLSCLPGGGSFDNASSVTAVPAGALYARISTQTATSPVSGMTIYAGTAAPAPLPTYVTDSTVQSDIDSFLTLSIPRVTALMTPAGTSLFNPGTITDATVLNGPGVTAPLGATSGGFSGFYTSDYFYVGGVNSLYFAVPLLSNPSTNFAAICFYDYRLTTLSCQQGGSPLYNGYFTSVTDAVPAGAAFARITSQYNGSPLAGMLIYPGSAPPVLPASAATVQSQIAELQPASRQLFDIRRAVSNHALLLATGTVNNDGDSLLYVSDFMPVSGLSSVWISQPLYTNPNGNYAGWCFYDSKATMLSCGLGSTTAGALAVPSGAYSLRVMVDDTGNGILYPYYASTLTVTAGSTAPAVVSTPYDIAVSHRSGKKIAIFMDSYGGSYGTQWLPEFLQRTGAGLGYLDAHSGRAWEALFEQFGGFPASGTTAACPVVAGTYELANCVVGQTLTQALAGIDVIVIALGNNDPNLALGTTADTYPANDTAYGLVNSAIGILRQAAPTATVLLVGPSYTPYRGYAAMQTTDTNLKAAAQFNNAPYLSLFLDSGIGVANGVAMTQSDQNHWSNAAYLDRYAPLLASFVGRYF